MTPGCRCFLFDYEMILSIPVNMSVPRLVILSGKKYTPSHENAFRRVINVAKMFVEMGQ